VRSDGAKVPTTQKKTKTHRCRNDKSANEKDRAHLNERPSERTLRNCNKSCEPRENYRYEESEQIETALRLLWR